MVSNLIKLYIANFECLDYNSKQEIFDQIYLDEVCKIYKYNSLIYDYKLIDNGNNIRLYKLSFNNICNFTLSSDSMYNFHKEPDYYYYFYNDYLGHTFDLLINNKLYDEIVEKIELANLIT